MTLENLVSVRALWAGEEIKWYVKPKSPGVAKMIEAWIKKIIRGIKNEGNRPS